MNIILTQIDAQWHTNNTGHPALVLFMLAGWLADLPLTLNDPPFTVGILPLPLGGWLAALLPAGLPLALAGWLTTGWLATVGLMPLPLPLPILPLLLPLPLACCTD